MNKNTYQGGTNDSAIQENIQILTGQKGSCIDRAVTLRDLLKFNIVTKTGSLVVEKNVNSKYILKLTEGSSSVGGNKYTTTSSNSQDKTLLNELEKMQETMFNELNLLKDSLNNNDSIFMSQQINNLITDKESLLKFITTLFSLTKQLSDRLEIANTRIAELEQK